MKQSLLVIVLTAMSMMLNAKPVDRSKASALASGFIHLMMEEQSREDEVVSFQEWNESHSYAHLYLFNGNHCFVLLSADDRAYPILGYSLDRCFDVDDMAENTSSWLRSYNDDIQYLIENDIEATEEVAESWLSLENGVLQVPADRAEVAPLLGTSWGQREPFNYYCPNHTMTGCVSTAMAQIMKYWEYPNKGKGSHSYSHPSYGTLQANFGSTTYDWDHMPMVATASSPTAVQQALGTLSYQCGVAVEMNYGQEVSTSVSPIVCDAMVNYFRYSSGITLSYKDNGYTDSSWKTFVKDELKRSRPLYYAGESSEGAHAFVCDGFDIHDHFHVNWGWTGKNDGYYAIGQLNPEGEGTFNEYNHVITGIEPLPSSLGTPANLTATVEENQVYLQWSASSGASGYKIYRDGETIANNVTGSSYRDSSVGPGSHTYFVRGFNANGDRSRKSNEVEVDVPAYLLQPASLASSVQSNELVLHWTLPVAEEASLYYGSSSDMGTGYGYGGNYPTYWGQRYPVERIADYNGMALTKVRCFFKNSATYTLYVGKGNALGVTETLVEQTFVVNGSGAKDIILENPVVLDGYRDLWVVIRAPASVSYPAVSCPYQGNGLDDACYISTDFVTWYSQASDNLSWMMSVKLSLAPYSYRVKRDDVFLGEVAGDMEFTDDNLSLGTHRYRVTTVYGDLSSKPSEKHTVEIVKNEVTVVGNGEVEGDGYAQVGEWVSL
nr:C10 family peptidase [Bacteroidales bacterium]